MKRLIFYFMGGIMFSLLSSCNMNDVDEYSLDNAWIGFGLVQKENDAGEYKILMDDNEVLFPVSSEINLSELKNNDRILVNFTILGNKENENHDEYYYVKINSYRKILYKGILDITSEIEDSIGNDPIHVKDKWIKNNLLNFELQFYGSNKIHFINLVKQPGENTEPIILELRHNNNDDLDGIPMSAMVTFDLGSLKVDGKDSVSFKVTAKDFNGDNFEYSGVYKY